MKREWKETIAPKYLHETMGIYNGIWMPQMDRCWTSTDGYQAMSRILITDWGKVEHVSITYHGDQENALSQNGERDIPWKVKQEIKNELFGEDRIAIEIFPEEKKMVDVMDVYHLWVFPKGYSLPFGIHPKDKQCRVVNRGCPKDAMRLAQNSLELNKNKI